MDAELKASYAHCRDVARRSARNFFYSFMVLPRAKRRAMCALYAFLRHTDDLGDSLQPVGTRRTALVAWRAALAAAFEGRFDSPLLPALVDTVARYRIPRRYLFDAIDGVEMDLDLRRYETFADLCEYCHKVASVVGLACIHIWGFDGEYALGPAARLGIGFQLTNILRDLKEDIDRGRLYLPLEDLRQFGYSATELARGVCDERFRALVAFEIERARDYYRQGRVLEQWISPDSRLAFRVMVGIYSGLLDEIARRDGDVLAHRVRLGPWRKLRIVARAFAPPRRLPSPVGPLRADAR